jgi:hypothetical protein
LTRLYKECFRTRGQLKETVSWDRFGFWGHAWSVLGLNRGHGLFLSFLGAPMIYKAKSVFFAVNASLRWLNNVSGAYLIQVSSLLIGPQEVGRFLQVSALASHWLEDCANFTPTPVENDQYRANHSCQWTIILHLWIAGMTIANIISQLKLALTTRNILSRYKIIRATKKFKKLIRPLFRPKTYHTCHQKTNSSCETIPLSRVLKTTLWRF